MCLYLLTDMETKDRFALKPVAQYLYIHMHFSVFFNTYTQTHIKRYTQMYFFVFYTNIHTAATAGTSYKSH